MIGWPCKTKLYRTLILSWGIKITISWEESHGMNQNKMVHLGSGSHWQSHNCRTQTGAEQHSDLGCLWLNIAEHVPNFVDLKSVLI